MKASELRRDVTAALAEAVQAVEAAAQKAEALLRQYQGDRAPLGDHLKLCSVCGKMGHNARRHAG